MVNQPNQPAPNKRPKRPRRPLWLLLLLGVAPLQLGAKGCDTGVVGSDRTCGGLTGASCGDGQFCDFSPAAQCGAADATGVCRPLPEACDLMFAPVCGCDDVTYGNACAANLAGVSVAHDGECGAPDGDECGGLAGLACDSGEFCDFAPDALCGAADATGVCRPLPEACDLIYAPVCGCDGKTYGNACAANMAGVSVASQGECEPDDGQSCGGITGAACAAGEFCDYAPDASCGAGDATGECRPIPEACPAVFDPVCGCDDQTYGNACEANRAGVSVASSAACEPAGAVCGGLRGATCASGEFCDFPLNARCGAADATGVCRSIPDACDAVLDPVCGCDGKTYGNACEANGAGVSVASPGACDDKPGETCGGLIGQLCPEGEYCDFPPDQLCGLADGTGTCRIKPDACTADYDPVCGCDGQTYSNACMAAVAGVSVQSSGECSAAR